MYNVVCLLQQSILFAKIFILFAKMAIEYARIRFHKDEGTTNFYTLPVSSIKSNKDATNDSHIRPQNFNDFDKSKTYFGKWMCDESCVENHSHVCYLECYIIFLAESLQMVDIIQNTKRNRVPVVPKNKSSLPMPNKVPSCSVKLKRIQVLDKKKAVNLRSLKVLRNLQQNNCNSKVNPIMHKNEYGDDAFQSDLEEDSLPVKNRSDMNFTENVSDISNQNREDDQCYDWKSEILKSPISSDVDENDLSLMAQEIESASTPNHLSQLKCTSNNRGTDGDFLNKQLSEHDGLNMSLEEPTKGEEGQIDDAAKGLSATDLPYPANDKESNISHSRKRRQRKNTGHKGRGQTVKFLVNSLKYYSNDRQGKEDRSKRYKVDDDMIYLGEGIRVPSASWIVIQDEPPNVFLRSASILIWQNEKCLANRALQAAKVRNRIPNRSPVKQIEANLLRLLISLYWEFIERTQKELDLKSKIRILKKATINLSLLIRDLRSIEIDTAIEKQNHQPSTQQRSSTARRLF